MPREIEVGSVLNKTKKRDAWFLDDYTINLYSSCSFNCLYCYIRGSKYGSNLESSLSVKTNAIDILDRQLFRRANKGEYGIIVLSSATDPYVQIEEGYQLTRRTLELILHYKFPVHVITKSHHVERDIDLLHAIDRSAILPKDLQISLGRGAMITFSFSTVDDTVGKRFEPGAPSPSQRLVGLEKMKTEGFLTGVSMMPMLPFISDTKESLAEMFSAFKRVGADYVMPATITLFGSGKADSKTLVMNVIQKDYPELLARYRKYFQTSHQLPNYYRRAFHQKMKEMSKEYDLPDRILAAHILQKAG